MGIVPNKSQNFSLSLSLSLSVVTADVRPGEGRRGILVGRRSHTGVDVGV